MWWTSVALTPPPVQAPTTINVHIDQAPASADPRAVIDQNATPREQTTRDEAKAARTARREQRRRCRHQRKQRPQPRARTVVTAPQGAIVCIEGKPCEIRRSFLDQMLSDPSAVPRVRVVPYRRDGESAGFKVFAIRSGSVLSLLGLRNGDVLTAINGHPLRTQSDVLGSPATLRQTNDFALTLERKGEPVTLRYRIVDG